MSGVGLPGRIQKKLIMLLKAEGFSSVRLMPAQGRWRSDPHFDVYRWEGNAVDADGNATMFYSWETMTKCVRLGIKLVRENGWTIDVQSRAPELLVEKAAHRRVRSRT